MRGETKGEKRNEEDQGGARAGPVTSHRLQHLLPVHLTQSIIIGPHVADPAALRNILHQRDDGDARLLRLADQLLYILRVVRLHNDPVHS